MGAEPRNPVDTALRILPVEIPWGSRPARFVRLSHLRKLRECEQVAAVCYRVRGGVIEFLLVRTRGSKRWTFPKGSAEPGLTRAQAAALEAFEEAGVHGRIEEVAFARYVRRERCVVNAHLCEVLRLSTPNEGDRNRTWFSDEDARRRLQERRTSKDGAEFARVVDQAVARIQRIGSATGIVDDGSREDRWQPDRPEWNAARRDALQQVQFDFAEVYGRMNRTSLMPPVHHQLSEMPQTAVAVADADRRILQSRVLEFEAGLAGEKKPKALRR